MLEFCWQYFQFTCHKMKNAKYTLPLNSDHKPNLTSVYKTNNWCTNCEPPRIKWLVYLPHWPSHTHSRRTQHNLLRGPKKYVLKWHTSGIVQTVQPHSTYSHWGHSHGNQTRRIPSDTAYLRESQGKPQTSVSKQKIKSELLKTWWLE